MKLGRLNRKSRSKCNRAVQTVQFIHLLYIIIDRVQGREVTAHIFADIGWKGGGGTLWTSSSDMLTNKHTHSHSHLWAF